MFSIEVDNAANAMYVTVGADEIVRTVEISKAVSVDLNADGFIVGIEVLGLNSLWSANEVLSRFKVRDELTATAIRMAEPPARGLVITNIGQSETVVPGFVAA